VQTISKQKLERQEGRKKAGNKPFLKAGQIADHRAHILSHRAHKTELPHKTEKQTANHHNILTAERADGTLTLPQRQGVGQRNKPPAQKFQ
jgi:hypothetical protein